MIYSPSTIKPTTDPAIIACKQYLSDDILTIFSVIMYLEVLHPELVLHGSCLLLKLSTAILKSIRSLLQVPKLPVPLQDILHILVHDADNLVHLKIEYVIQIKS